MELRTKTAQYKQLKADLAAIRAETVVLNRTEQIMRSRGGDVGEFVKQMEARKGVAGYSETQERLEQVSEKTSTLNDAKGKPRMLFPTVAAKRLGQWFPLCQVCTPCEKKAKLGENANMCVWKCAGVN